MATNAPNSVTPERLMQIMWGYTGPLMLEAAVRHGVFDLLDKGPQTLDQVVTATGASARGVRMLMNALVGLDFLSKDGQDRYALTPESAAFLVSSKPGYLGGMIRHTSTQLLPNWMHLNQIVRTGKPATAVNQQATGSAFFQEFVEDLFPFGYRVAQLLADELGVAQAKRPVSVLDLAAGSGVWSIALAQKSNQVRVTAVDWPGVIDVTRKVATKHGVVDRFRFVSGDLQQADFGQNHQIATLGHILHSEGEARSRALLKKTADALAPSGTIMVAEFLVNDDRTGPANGLMFAVNMLVNTDVGDTFSFHEIKGWLEEAGFGKVRSLECPGPSPLILAEKR